MKRIIYSITWVCKDCASVCGSTDGTVPHGTCSENKVLRQLGKKIEEFTVEIVDGPHDWIPVKVEVVK